MKTYRYRRGPAALLSVMAGVIAFIGGTTLVTVPLKLPLTIVASMVFVFGVYGTFHYLTSTVRITPDAVIRSGCVMYRIGFRNVKAIRIEKRLIGLQTWWLGRYDIVDMTDMEDLINEVLAAASEYPGVQIYDVRGTE